MLFTLQIEEVSETEDRSDSLGTQCLKTTKPQLFLRVNQESF